MPSRSTIWFRDAFVIIFAIYVVVSIAMVPWSNLKITEPASTSCPSGCSPSINFPEDNYHHYDDSLIFDWNPVAVTYRAVIVDSEGQVVLETNLTEFNSTTSSRLKVGNYTSSVYYTGITGSNFSVLIKTVDHQLDSSSKITLQWDNIGVTYTIQIREFDDENRDFPIIHEATNLTETLYEYSNFVEGKEYTWSVFAVDNLGFSSESSSQSDLRIGTTKFLAFMLFNDWEVPFLLLGVMMVVALQAGVFLAREEKDD
ncbi:MAG: hypothetical protein BEU01_00985 [Marine Group III euryarchaeote CG-Epi4]|uniref:Fibronectin type-III domain-containing protein n=1 Tax=Marine Group III euryarchaeote CG-Epi4 TaxID=1888998 RepID=A0A1J5U3U1_9ARCH|nr:MAG: hypothetical protein BEU01_00985 [Marine Group III euryarchaeote CG-Epi4]